MSTPDVPQDAPDEAQAEQPAKQHGDPLLAAAQGRADGDDGSRHGADATGTADPGQER